MSDSPYWVITFENHDYHWYGLSSLSSGRLRAYNNTYGPEFGKAYALNQLFLAGVVDAVCCVVWSLLKDRAKEEPGFKAYNTPNDLPDFSVGDLVNAMYTELLMRTADDPDPTEAPVEELSESTPSQVQNSTSTSTSGEESSSPPSRRSSGSRSTK